MHAGSRRAQKQHCSGGDDHQGGGARSLPPRRPGLQALHRLHQGLALARANALFSMLHLLTLFWQGQAVQNTPACSCRVRAKAKLNAAAQVRFSSHSSSDICRELCAISKAGAHVKRQLPALTGQLRVAAG